MRKVLKNLAFSLNCISATLAFTNAHAQVLQNFLGLNYSNPAALNLTKEWEFIAGGNWLDVSNQFQGQISGGPVGTITGGGGSHYPTYLPYGRLAYRVNPKLVLGVDVTDPFFVDMTYDPNSIVAFSGTRVLIRDIDISPRFSYQLTQQLAIGAGVNINYNYDGELSFVIPGQGELVNTGHALSYGFNVGLFYAFSKTTFLNLSYYSALNPTQAGGVSYIGGTGSIFPRTSTNDTLSSHWPATTILNLTKFVTQKLALFGTVRYSQWSNFPFLAFKNTAVGDVVIPQHFSDGWSFTIGGNYQYTPNLSFLAGFFYDANVQPTEFRIPSFPIYTLVAPVVGGEYKMTENFKAKLIYSHAFSNPNIRNQNLAGLYTGSNNINIDIVDLGFTYSK